MKNPIFKIIAVSSSVAVAGDGVGDLGDSSSVLFADGCWDGGVGFVGLVGVDDGVRHILNSKDFHIDKISHTLYANFSFLLEVGVHVFPSHGLDCGYSSRVGGGNNWLNSSLSFQ